MRRVASRAVVPLAVLALGALPWLVWWDHLPERVATHWGPGGGADAHTARSLAAAISCGAVLVPAVVLAVIELRPRRARVVGAGGVVVAFFGGTFGAASLATVLANRDQASWEDASFDQWAVGLVLLAGVAFAAVAAARLPLRPRLTSGDPQWVAPADGDLSWKGSARAGWALAAAAVLLALTALALVIVELMVPAVIVALTILGLVPLVVLHVEIGPQGMRMSTAVGRPRQVIPMNRIASVESIDVDPLAWGGWGYRGSLRALDRAAWVLRRGPGLHLTLDDGRSFVVTVDDAPEGAAVLRALLASAGRPAPTP